MEVPNVTHSVRENKGKVAKGGVCSTTDNSGGRRWIKIESLHRGSKKEKVAGAEKRMDYVFIHLRCGRMSM